MSAPSRLPPSLRAQRVLLWIIAVLMWLNAVATAADTERGFYGIGAAAPFFLAGVLCAVLARRLPDARRWVRVTVIVLHVVVLLGEIGRLQSGDMRALIGLLFPIVGLVLILQRGTRRYFADTR